MQVGYPFPHSGMFLKGTTGEFAAPARVTFFRPFFVSFSNTLLETILEPLDAILVHFGCHFVSILDAPGHKNEVRNASPSSTGQTP